MNEPQIQAVIIERELPHPPEKVWRALTQPELIEEWLMKNDNFGSTPGSQFTLSGDWGSVNCEVLECDPEKTLSYSWVGMGIETVVTWTLVPSATGTHLRMEQSGFRVDQERACQGAKHGWESFFGNLEQLLSRAE